MTSQDLGYFCDYYSITGWYQNRFKASYLSDDAGIYNIAGVSGSYFDGISCSIFSGDGADFTPYPSEITPATGGDAAINYAGGSNPCAGVVHDGTYKLVYFAFPWEVIGSQVDRDTVLIRVLSFLRGDISVNESLLKPESPQIVSAQPNPFNAAVNIEFDARNSGDAELSIYDASGRKVTTLFKGKVQPGEYNRVWDATDDSGNKLPSGIYLTKLEIEGKSITKKIVLIK